jgi:hypothetical protein
MKQAIILFLCSVSLSVLALTDAAVVGFSPTASGMENMKALQKAVDQAGTITVTQPGVYKIAGTVYVGSNTSLIFGNGVILQKVNEQGAFSHVLLNKGALTKIYDEYITVEGLQIMVNGMDVRTFKDVFGLHGQLAFFYVKDLRIEHFRCLDLGKAQYGIHVCTFEDLVIDDVLIKGMKDGVHLGGGKRFTIRNSVFETFDDALALNAHDYDVGNPELNWIEDGLVENCHDLNAEKTTGYFCRILAGAWVDWRKGMEVQKSDTVVSDGRLYRVSAAADGKRHPSLTQPTHISGKAVLDNITWVMVQTNVTYTVGVRNVTFRDIFLAKPRTSFSIHFDNDKYSRSYYPGATIPLQQGLVFDNVKVLHDAETPFLSIATPIDSIVIANSTLRNNALSFISNKAMSDYGKTAITMSACTFSHPGKLALLKNSIENKKIDFVSFGSMVLSEQFEAIFPKTGMLRVTSDLVRK